MNWQEIKEKYPKAHNEFGRWFFKDLDWDKELEWLLEKQNAVYTRDLYDFFDENGIMIFIRPSSNDLGLPDGFGIIIGESYFKSWHFSTRTEAEESAFEKAFEILEQKLGD